MIILWSTFFYYFPGQAAQDRQTKTPRKTGNLGKVYQYRWHRTGSPVQVAQDRQPGLPAQERELETGSLGQVDQCRLAQVRQPKTGSTGQPTQERMHRTASPKDRQLKTGSLGKVDQDSQHRMGSPRFPEQDRQQRTGATEKAA